MEDRAILDCICGLVAQARHLRDLRDSGRTGEPADTERLRALESEIDEMWTLLRRRRALRAEGADPDDVDLRTSTRSSA